MQIEVNYMSYNCVEYHLRDYKVLLRNEVVLMIALENYIGNAKVKIKNCN